MSEPLEFRLGEIKLPTGTVHYQYAGEGPPVACFHDSAGSVITRTVERLATRHTVLMPIVPGFDGTPFHRSVQQSRTVHSMPGLANILATFIEAAVGAPCDLIGQSFGARVALWIAAQRPDLIGRLVVQGPTGLRQDGRGGIGKGIPAPGGFPVHLYPERAPPSGRTPEEIEINRGVPSHYHQDAPFDDALAERLGFIKAETLILLGTEDQLVPVDVAYFIRSRIHRARLTFVHDAAHAVDSDQPDRVAGIVERFLQRGAAYIVKDPATAALP